MRTFKRYGLRKVSYSDSQDNSERRRSILSLAIEVKSENAITP